MPPAVSTMLQAAGDGVGDHSTTATCLVDDDVHEFVAPAMEAMTQPPTMQRTTREKGPRSVRFVETDPTIHEYDGVEDETHERVWYTREEYDIIKSRNSLIVKMKKAGTFQEEESDHSFRGLEHKLKEGYGQRRENKFAALNAVLDEQDRQYARDNMVGEPQSIADAYRRVTLNARDSAFLLGCRDAEDSYAFTGVVATTTARIDMEEAQFQDDKNECDDDEEDDGVDTDVDTVYSETSRKKKGRIRRLIGKTKKKVWGSSSSTKSS